MGVRDMATPGDHPRTPSDAHGPAATQGQPITIVHASPSFRTNLPIREEAKLNNLEAALDINRHKHDGTQPTLEKAAPSHKADVEWTIKH